MLESAFDIEGTPVKNPNASGLSDCLVVDTDFSSHLYIKTYIFTL